ncbi:MAG TPA: alpha/beta hydrolase [Acidobacteriaceae bacterium]|jgi:pimeloyl-ACP methyl ester carboxylesterase|nr:alpha/beta hydrolase [Acidobacteriaceae bacterium]
MTNPEIHLTQWSRFGTSDPAVVLVHGGAQGSARRGDQHFSRQSRLATEGWRVIVPDRPGHGLSPSPGRPDDAEADGLWVADLLGDGAHLVGHSFGGSVALAAAALRPDAVLSLTFIEPAMHALAAGDPRVQEFFKGMMAVHAGEPSAAEVATRFLKQVGLPAEVRESLDTDELERIGEAIRRMKLPSADWLRTSLDNIKARGVPALVVTGGWSPAYEAVGDVVSGLCGAARVVVASDHHLLHSASDEFNQHLAEFMRQADLERRSHMA